ncbi:MAG: hypothetical protein NT162_02240, partial [Candidatus Woesebacteria bacterium]|nr:hypothetical protein [Candidatus Woesebacteria bacterium]
PKDKDASEKPAEIIKIIDNCLAEKYKFLDQDKNDLEIIYLNAEGRDFVNPPYFRPFYNKEWSFGLLKAYVKAIGPVWQIIIIIITALIGFIFGKLQ